MTTQVIKTIAIVLFCVSVLGPMLAWAQSNDTSSITKLRIAIPVREFTEFVSVKRDFNTGESNYSGFAIEVFKEVMNSSLPTIPFQFIPFQRPDGSMNGTFDDMLKAVSNKDYSGAAGEISILSYRTEWVDFTMPFLDSSITMLVRTKQETASTIARLSLIGIVEAFLITTYVMCFVVAVIYFLGLSRWARYVGGSLDRPRDKTLGSLIHTRLMLTTFFLIILIPVACYIISQVSSTTTRRGSSIKTLADLIKPDVNVGYPVGSHIYNLLLQKGFSESNLISLKSEDEMVEKLSKGSSQNGVDAIVANDIHLKLLEGKHCDEFITVPTTDLLSSGFGFAFDKGSNITGAISNGILKMIDDGRMMKIQETTIGKLEACPDDHVDVGSGFLPPRYKWILIVGGLLVVLFAILSIASLY